MDNVPINPPDSPLRFEGRGYIVLDRAQTRTIDRRVEVRVYRGIPHDDWWNGLIATR